MYIFSTLKKTLDLSISSLELTLVLETPWEQTSMCSCCVADPKTRLNRSSKLLTGFRHITRPIDICLRDSGISRKQENLVPDSPKDKNSAFCHISSSSRWINILFALPKLHLTPNGLSVYQKGCNIFHAFKIRFRIKNLTEIWPRSLALYQLSWIFRTRL